MTDKKPLSCTFNPESGGVKGVAIGSNSGLHTLGAFMNDGTWPVGRRYCVSTYDPPVLAKNGETIRHDYEAQIYKVVNDATGATVSEGKMITVYADPPKCICATRHPDYCEVHVA